MQSNDTICAISTPPGAGGIGVVRISGSMASKILAKVWQGRVKTQDFESHHLYLGRVVDPNGEAIDRVMAVIMRAPATYTGEDVVELSAHGSQVVLKGILRACTAAGARPAAPGELTRRAFMAGKIDLIQAEAVAELIGATNERAARIASQGLSGRLSSKIGEIQGFLADIRAEIEAAIDFPEEDIEVAARAGLATRLDDLSAEIERLVASFGHGRQICEGVRAVIVGKPNAGKSSIFNRLVGRERAIVHHVPGTTRDVVEESLEFGGMLFKLSDTAGIREGSSEVENLGIMRTHDELKSADVVLAVFDRSRPFEKEDEQLLAQLDPKKTIFVINKMDMVVCHSCESRNPGMIESIEALDSRLRGNDKLNIGNDGLLKVSASTGENIEKIKDALLTHATADVSLEDGFIITNARHKGLLEDAKKFVDEAVWAISHKYADECIASHLVSAQDSLNSITGEVTTEDILDRIFSKFCIGK